MLSVKRVIGRWHCRKRIYCQSKHSALFGSRICFYVFSTTFLTGAIQNAGLDIKRLGVQGRNRLLVNKNHQRFLTFTLHGSCPSFYIKLARERYILFLKSQATNVRQNL